MYELYVVTSYSLKDVLVAVGFVVSQRVNAIVVVSYANVLSPNTRLGDVRLTLSSESQFLKARSAKVVADGKLIVTKLLLYPKAPLPNVVADGKLTLVKSQFIKAL
jgi:hypothetical protein